jgi:hypothetical protein
MGRRGLLCRCLRREKADGRFFDDADERAGAKVGVLVLRWRPNCLARRLVYALPNEKGSEL